MSLSIPISLLAWHFVADFFLQSDSMATKKSTSNFWLSTHCIIYSIPFVFVVNFKYALVNGIAHFLVDFITSRMTSYLYKKEQRHWFFTVIGLDQLIHAIILASTYLTLG